jgi:hypothetical protein
MGRAHFALCVPAIWPWSAHVHGQRVRDDARVSVSSGDAAYTAAGRAAGTQIFVRSARDRKPFARVAGFHRWRYWPEMVARQPRVVLQFNQGGRIMVAGYTVEAVLSYRVNRGPGKYDARSVAAAWLQSRNGPGARDGKRVLIFPIPGRLDYVLISSMNCGAACPRRKPARQARSKRPIIESSRSLRWTHTPKKWPRRRLANS